MNKNNVFVGRAGLILGLAIGTALPAARADVPLIPRKVLFGNPVKTAPQLSPDGTRLAYIAPSDKGVANVWVQTVDKNDSRMVTQDAHRGIYTFDWAADGQHILYQQDRDGDENWHLYAIDLPSRVVRDLTPFVGIRAQNVLTDPKHPDELLVGLNLRDRRVFDMYRVNLKSGAVALDTPNPGEVMSWATDDNFVIRAATVFDSDARTIVRVRDRADAPWRDLLVSPFEESSFYGQMNGGSLVCGFTADGQGLYVVSPLGSDKTRLVRLDVKTGKELEVLAADPRSDVEYFIGQGISTTPAVVTDPRTGRVQAVAFNYTRLEWKVIDPAIADDFRVLQESHPGVLTIVSRDRDDARWLVRYAQDDGPVAYCLYDRSRKTTRPLFEEEPALRRYKLAKSKPLVIRSRDGLDLVCYLTLPPDQGEKNLPLIVFPHGGPWFRDRGGFDPVAQLLANRGYAVLQVNFRGSTGFGKKFLNASNHEFGDGAVLRDVTDAVQWTIDGGIADIKRIGILGGSFGGYATLAQIAFNPDRYACAVDLVGPSNLRTLFQSMPDYWKPVKKRWALRMGDVEHDDALNQRLSPLFHADRIRTPLLIGHGAHDPRVNIVESERIVAELRARRRPMMFVVYPDEGHGFARPENNLDFFGRVEEFLAKHLGGRAEPWEKIPGSTAEVR
jgi:dipeptidyl aminopeptidase/acylaminoacyl peptidase